MSRGVVVPAAGRGSRLGHQLPKLLVPVAGQAMIDHVLRHHGDVPVIVVVSPSAESAVREHFAARDTVTVTVQREPTGMLDAILTAIDPVGEASAVTEVWITWCDQVAIRPETVARLATAMAAQPQPAMALPTAWQPEPYIHFSRDAEGRISGVRQRREGDAMPPVGEGDCGLFALRREAFLDALPRFAHEAPLGAATRERNFLPFIPWLAARAPVQTVPATAAIEAIGINTPDDLRRLEAHLQREIADG